MALDNMNNSEEVKLEKKFCTRCGKELNEGEDCGCLNKKANFNFNKDELISLSKEILNSIINMIKKPASTLKEKVAENNIKKALIILVLIAITYGLTMISSSNSLVSIFNGSMGTNLNDYVNIPYFKIFLYTTLINFLMAFIPVIVTFVGARVTSNKNFDLKKSLSLYAYSSAPLIFSNIIMAILYGLNILSWVGSVITIGVSIVCFLNYILGILSHLSIQEDRKTYVISGIIISWVLGCLIAIVLFGGSLVTDITKEINYNNNDYNINNSFNW